jgi:hypothetical protein
MNVSALLLEIPRQFNAHYTANSVPNRAHGLPFTLCELWSRTYAMYLQLRILRLQYSTERICTTIGDNRTYRCALYCKHGSKYSAHSSFDAVWTLIQDIYNVNKVPHILDSVFNWTYHLILEKFRQFNASYTAIFVPNTAFILQITLSELCSRPYTV